MLARTMLSVDYTLSSKSVLWGKQREKIEHFTKQKRSLCLLYFQSSNKSKYQNSVAGENILHHEQQGL